MATTDTQDAIRQLYERILAAWNRRDAAALAAGFAKDGSMVGFDGSQVDTRAAIEQHLAPIFQDHPMAAFVAKVREVRPLGADCGLLRAVAGMVPPSLGDISPSVNTVHTLVAVRDGGQWHAALFQSTPAAWHGRPADVAALTAELREAHQSGGLVQ